MPNLLLQSQDSLLLVVDVQVKLWNQIANREAVRENCRILIQGAQKLSVPLLITEQYPKGLGPTLPELRPTETEGGMAICEKTSFGCLGEPALVQSIEQTGRRNLVICGIEAHVCILQTALEALEKGFSVAVVADAIGSRSEHNRHLALERMRQSGVILLSTEMILFEWMRSSSHPAFKDISKLVK